jgi:hypothetical protein
MAESFTTLGAGNGFPFCLPTLDVSTLHPDKAWVTLSGFKESTGGSPSEASVAESKRLAMLYFWNAKTLGGSAIEYTNILQNPEIPESPKDRICLPSSGNIYAELDSGLSSYNEQYGIGFYVYGSSYFSGGDSLFAMYNGSELIGYGIGGGYAYSWGQDGLYSADVEFGSIQFSTGDSYENEYEKFDVKYTTISMGNETIHVVGEAYAYDSEQVEPYADAISLTAADYLPTPYTKAEITGITLHTY